jgi:hypothetical protein
MEPGVFDELLHYIESRVDRRSILPMDTFGRRAILFGLALDHPVPTEKVVAADVRHRCDFCDCLPGYNDRLVWAMAEFGALWIA